MPIMGGTLSQLPCTTFDFRYSSRSLRVICKKLSEKYFRVHLNNAKIKYNPYRHTRLP